MPAGDAEMYTLLLLRLSTAMATTDPSIVASKNAEVVSMTRKEARQVFTLRRTEWPNGVPIRLVLPVRGSNEDLWLSKTVLGLPPDAYQRFLAEQAYRRGGTVPKRTHDAGFAADAASASSDEALVGVVSSLDKSVCHSIRITAQ